MKQAPKMPEEYKGKVNTSGGYTKTAPRVWTAEEIEWVNNLIEQGFTSAEIAESIDRTQVSTSIKIKRLGKKERTYNNDHVADKCQTNIDFLKFLNPTKCIDVYAGEQSFYTGYCDVISNDKNVACKTDYHMDALRFLCKMYADGEKADLIDLDPFGSAYDCFDLAIKMAQKGIVITLGEMGHKRWKRLDYVGRYYGVEKLEDFTLDRLIEHIQSIGRRNKKDLVVYAKKEWRNVGRVWFTINPLKITEQWEGKVDENKKHTDR